jgi:hypothetical protein
MKKATSFCVLIFIALGLFAQAEDKEIELHLPEINTSVARDIALQHISVFMNTEEINMCFGRELNYNNQTLAYIFDIYPLGYVVVSNSVNLPPIIAYSTESHFGDFDSKNPLYKLICSDISKRLIFVSTEGSVYAEKNRNAWLLYGSTDIRTKLKDRFEQWPAVGDGWLQTPWNQNAPYNNMCPMDPVTSNRSIAGCPSVAMALIVNFHKTTNNTRFTDGDDYYHNYAGRQYWIDNDYFTLDFPSFPQLNEYLDTLDAHFASFKPLTNQDKAALTFACGVACTQVYTSQASGTFGVNQAYDAYLRFGFTTISLLDESDLDLYDRLQQNIKDTLPAHLAIVDSAWTMGHNVAVDGYNTNDYYHINFGWGGTFDGWYLLPDEMPYGLTVVEGLIIDIVPPNYAEIIDSESNQIECNVFPNPTSDILIIEIANPENLSLGLNVYDLNGKLVKQCFHLSGSQLQISTSELPQGMYYFSVLNETRTIGNGKFVVD